MNEISAIDLDAIGILEGVDKSSLRGDISCSWDYLRHYDAFFHEFKNKPINVIEIGVANGASLNVWLRYFDCARIVGIDIEPSCARFAKGRAEVRIGSQADPEFLRSVAADRPPTIVIDDGSHMSAHMIGTFETLFPLLAPGGVYVIEDVVFHYRTDDGKIFPHNPNEREFPGVFTHDLINNLVMARLGQVTHLPPASTLQNDLYAEIDEIRVVGGMVAIRKRKPRDIDAVVAAIEARLKGFASESVEKHARGCFRLAEYLLTQGRLDAALRYAHEGVSTGLDDVYGMQVHRAILLRLHRESEAAEVAKRIEGHGFSIDLPDLVKPNHMGYPHK
jgi:hypothetical protein